MQYYFSSCGCGASGSSDKISKIIYLDNTLKQFEYDTFGNLTKRKDANNKTIEYVYDALNRLSKVFYGGKVSAVKTVVLAIIN